MDEVGYQAKVRLKAVIAVYMFLFRNNREILMMKRENTGYQDGKWDVPSGHLEEGELPVEALIREVKEEVGVEVVDNIGLSLVHTSYRVQHDKTGNRIDLFFATEEWSGEPAICEPHKCAEIAWQDIRFLHHESVSPVVAEAIAHWRNGFRFSQFGVDWLKERGLYKL